MALEPHAKQWMPTDESPLDSMVQDFHSRMDDEEPYVSAASLANARPHMQVRSCSSMCNYPTALHDMFEQGFGCVNSRTTYETGLPQGASWAGTQSIQALGRVLQDYDSFRPGDRCWNTEGAWYGIPTSDKAPLDPTEGYGLCDFGKYSVGMAGIDGYAGDGAKVLQPNQMDTDAEQVIVNTFAEFEKQGPVQDMWADATSLVPTGYPYM